MKNKYIKDIKEREHITDVFLVTKKETAISKTGKPYLNLRLMDSTGELEARVWDDAEECGKGFQKNDVVTIKGFAVAYQGGVQLNVTSVKALPEGGYSLRDFLPCSKKDPKAMAAELEGLISGMKDRHLKALLTAIFNDPEIKEKFMIAPAAKSMHHPYLGGLAEHVLSICALAGKVVEHYGSGINKDLLTAGAILHDIGKIYELSYQRSFEYTDEGRLIGHITMGVELIDRKLPEVKDFPRELSILLKHLILSHHGTLEFGSPKRPKTIEAIILSYLDDMDAKVNTVHALIQQEGDGSNWTAYQRLFERYIYKAMPPVTLDEAPEEGEGKGGKEDKNGNLSLFR